MFSQKNNKTDSSATLGETLDTLENQIGRLNTGLAVDGLQVLRLLDNAAARMDELQSRSNGPVAEAAQFEFILKRLKAEASLLLKAAGGPGGLHKGRTELLPGSPTAQAWWWRLDEFIARRRREQWARLLKNAAAAAAVLALLIFLYQRFLAPDPQTRAVLQAEQDARQMLSSDRTVEALAVLDRGLEAVPLNSELLLLKGAALTKIGQAAEAEAAFVAVEAQVPDRQYFLLARGQAFTAAGLPQKALDDGRAILVLNPQSPLAYMMMAQAHMENEDYRSAVAALDEAARLGNLQNNTQLVAQAKVQQAMIMEMMGAQALPQTGTR